MFKSYLKTAFRALVRHKGFTTMTVLGLALGMAVCLLILTFVWDQYNYDTFHTKKDRIYRVLSDRVQTGANSTAFAASPAPLAAVLEQEVPGIEQTARIGQIRTTAVHQELGVNVEGLYVEPSFFALFDFTLEQGDPQHLFAAPNQLILTRQAADRILGRQDPIGQTVTLEGHGDFIVAGLLAEPAGPSHLKFDMLASFASLTSPTWQAQLANWQNYFGFATYFLVEDETVLDRLVAVLPAISERHYAGQNIRLDFRAQALNDIVLGEILNNEISSYSVPAILVYFLAALALLIMVAAGFNYVSLSVARSLRRSQEVGVRKVMGARRQHVMFQFMSEAVLVALLALLGAYVLLSWLMPAFNQLTFVQMLAVGIAPSRLADPMLLGIFVLFSFGVGLIAGLYPALRLSRFQPVDVLKGTAAIKGFSGRTLRHSLTGIQFALALFFVTTAVLLYAQFNHLMEADYGFTEENILNVDAQGQSPEILQTALAQHASVAQISFTSELPASGSTASIAVWTEDSTASRTLYQYAVDPNFRENLSLRLVAGRDFSQTHITDVAEAVILNETAVRRLDLGTPAEAVGTWVRLGGHDDAKQVVGVVQDYHFDTLNTPLQGMIWQYDPSAFRYLNVRVQPGTLAEVEAHVEAVWTTLDPIRPVQYERFTTHLTDNILARTFRDFADVLGVLALLAILISYLGLLGMAMYTVETRVKEVGLRKVLGASQAQIVFLLSKSFIRLIAIATVLILPVVWLVNGAWLELFVIRITLNPWLLAGCVLLTAGLALVVIATQTFQAASRNPVDSLRYE